MIVVGSSSWVRLQRWTASGGNGDIKGLSRRAKLYGLVHMDEGQQRSWGLPDLQIRGVRRVRRTVGVVPATFGR